MELKRENNKFSIYDNPHIIKRINKLQSLPLDLLFEITKKLDGNSIVNLCNTK